MSFKQLGSSLVVASTLVGCGTSDSQVAPEPEPAYRQVDQNTYVIDGWDQSAKLPENLAKFRQDIGGDFTIVLGRYPLESDALALRNEVKTKDGETNKVEIAPAINHK